MIFDFIKNYYSNNSVFKLYFYSYKLYTFINDWVVSLTIVWLTSSFDKDILLTKNLKKYFFL